MKALSREKRIFPLDHERSLMSEPRSCNHLFVRLARSGALILLACLCLSTHAQTNEWAWMDGSSILSCTTYNGIPRPSQVCDQPGVYGTLGTFAAGNIPGSHSGAMTWTDSNGNLWLFGGGGYDANGNGGNLNDLWNYKPSTNQWAWIGGSSTAGQYGVYGTLGTFAAGNIPGSRVYASSWTDSSGNLWLFGGLGFDAGGSEGNLNDLWEYKPSAKEWAWMSGSSTVGSNGGQPGVYGTLGVFAAGNIPGSREFASSWTDSSGNFWLFGGSGFDANSNSGNLNDIWEYKPSTNQWAWMGGSSTLSYSATNGYGQPGEYGTLGAFAAGNIPGSRASASSWTDSGGNFWLFGGYGYDANGIYGELNDLWEYKPSTKEWAWMGGSNTVPGRGSGNPGVYGTLGVFAAGNIPGGRAFASSWTDSSGHLWLFGGAGYDANDNSVLLNDLWEFNPSTNEWAWIGGSSTIPNSGVSPGVYGTLGAFTAGNIPGSRMVAASWTDSSGNFWLFGGYGYDAAGNLGNLNDLWKYQPLATKAATALPTFSLAAGTYPSVQTVTISDTTPGATIYYTTDGTTPTTSSTVYSGPITVSSTETLEAIATATGYSQSAVSAAAYTIILSAATPIFSLAAGTYTSVQTVTISDTTPGATIYYTTNGMTPTKYSTVYSGPITVSWSEMLEAIATASGYSTSAVATAAYTITPLTAGSAVQWAWMGGSSTVPCLNCGQSGLYGTLGTFAAGNIPGSRLEATSWTDSSGNFWLFGGLGVDADGSEAGLNDLWQYKPSTNEWAWMGGSSTVGQPGVYGTLGVFAAGNIPGSRESASSWTDSSGPSLIGPITLVSATPASLLPGATTLPDGNALAIYQVGVSDGGGSSTVYTNLCTKTGAVVTCASPVVVTIPAGYYADDQSLTTLTNGTVAMAVTLNQTSTGYTFCAVQVGTIGGGDAVTWPGLTILTISGVPSGYGNICQNPSPFIQTSATTLLLPLYFGNSSNLSISGYGTFSSLSIGSSTTFVQIGPTPTVETNEYNESAGVVLNDGHLPLLIRHESSSYGGNFSISISLSAISPSFPTPTDNVINTGGIVGRPSLLSPDGVALVAVGRCALQDATIEDVDTTCAYISHDEGQSFSPLSDVGMGGGIDNYDALTLWQDGSIGLWEASANSGDTGSIIGYSTLSLQGISLLWLFGGQGYDAGGNYGYLNDLWEYKPSAKEWAWMSGSSTVPQTISGNPGVYGTLGTFAAGNIPGSRASASSWTDSSGNFWLFGGWGAGGTGYLNDLWEYKPSAKEWAWMGGSSTVSHYGVYGTLGTFAAGNIPGSRGYASSWTDSSGNLWLFGGWGFDAGGSEGNLNDLWEYKPSTNEWAWMSGGSMFGSNGGLPGEYGTLGTFAAGNIPGGRYSASSWTDSSGHHWLFGGAGYDANEVQGILNDLWKCQPLVTLSATAAPTFSLAAGTYTTTQTVTISDATPGAVIYYTTNGTTPTTSSTVYSGPITVSSTETLEAIATATGYTTSAVASAAYTITPPAATPTVSVAAGTYNSVQTVTISDATPGAVIYYTTNGTTPTTSSTVYSGPITISSSETLEAIATATGYTTSAVASAAYTISIPTNPVPLTSGITPAFASAGGTAFTLTVNGSGFTAGSTVYWGTSALVTTFGSATQLTAQVPATDIATGGITVAITVITPSPGGGTSNSFQFEVDSATGTTTGPQFSSVTQTVTAGSPASYPVTLPSTVESATVTCLNLPTGASCSYSAATNTVTIATSPTTPAGTYLVTVVFTETVTSAAFLLPILLLPLGFMRRKLAARGIWLTACLGLVLMASAALSIGCGSSGGGGSGSSTPPSTQQVTSSGSVSLTVQ